MTDCHRPRSDRGQTHKGQADRDRSGRQRSDRERSDRERSERRVVCECWGEGGGGIPFTLFFVAVLFASEV